MNSVQLTGRFTRDPEIRYTDGGLSIARFTLAVDRRFRQEGGPSADFIGCIAFGKTAEFIEKYFSKGKKSGGERPDPDRFLYEPGRTEGLYNGCGSGSGRFCGK